MSRMGHLLPAADDRVADLARDAALARPAPDAVEDLYHLPLRAVDLRGDDGAELIGHAHKRLQREGGLPLEDRDGAADGLAGDPCAGQLVGAAVGLDRP